jgi:ABC-type lipoprotein export system ATPase subunit
MIDLDDVFVLYPLGERQVAALRGLTLSVAAGERVVVNGPSGSGKSTLVRLVTGQVRPSAGRAVVVEHDLATASARAILALQRSGVGMITQQMADNLAVELTGRQNVAMQSRLMGRTRAEAARLATDMLDRLGVGHLADRPLATMSAGEAQRVALAAALAHRPRVIVADEPTGALDVVNANLVFDLLAELSTELHAALLVVSHDPNAGRIGHRVLEIRDGRLGAETLAGASTKRLVVDERGWMRLPESDRIRAGITSRAVVDTGESDSDRKGDSDYGVVVLAAAEGTLATAAATTRDSAVAAAEHPLVVDVVDVARRIGDQQILAPTTLGVRRGELLIVSGRSGSGKTTLLGLLAGFATPSAGTVSRTEPHAVAVGTAAPGFAESMSLRANIELACAVRGHEPDDRIDELLRGVALEELAERPVATLSGGERQRASIVRALCSNAELVLLDEPTSQLDQGLARRVARFLAEQAAGGRAIVCASHEPELIAAATRVHRLGEEPA